MWRQGCLVSSQKPARGGHATWEHAGLASDQQAAEGLGLPGPQVSRFIGLETDSDSQAAASLPPGREGPKSLPLQIPNRVANILGKAPQF